MNLQFSLEAWEEYCYWQDKDKKKLKRRNGYIGIGKPEPLKGDIFTIRSLQVMLPTLPLPVSGSPIGVLWARAQGWQNAC